MSTIAGTFNWDWKHVLGVLHHMRHFDDAGKCAVVMENDSASSQSHLLPCVAHQWNIRKANEECRGDVADEAITQPTQGQASKK